MAGDQDEPLSVMLLKLHKEILFASARLHSLLCCCHLRMRHCMCVDL